MRIGDFVTYGGRRYLLCGFDPAGVSPRMVYVEDVVTGVCSVLPFSELIPPPSTLRAELRLVGPSEDPPTAP